MLSAYHLIDYKHVALDKWPVCYSVLSLLASACAAMS
jgi:hypothetical protein